MGAVAFGFTLGLVVTYGLADSGPRAVPVRLSDLETTPSTSFEFQRPDGPQVPNNSGMRLASLEVPAGLGVSAEDFAPPAFATRASSALDERLDSFGERFEGAIVSYAPAPTRAGEMEEPADVARAPASNTREKTTVQSSIARLAPKPAASTPLASVAKKRVHTADLSQDVSSVPSADNHTAIYDISAHTVYMPNGRRLEAHSGLGSMMDDVRAINVKARGPTPPNVYDLTLREELFHGVRAIRLNPVDESKMFGRDGILAHTYMLGSNGQSNGCVSFSDYNAFLNAYLRGEVTRMVVVDHLATTPSPQTASQWFSDTVKDLFWRS
ncbi:MAG: hypothetical protein C5B56_15570 [Proteobacteria bacterium]|nr:MAG: hypothetical protein C5B56_15570 [Pseudomonadota bacterium]